MKFAVLLALWLLGRGAAVLDAPADLLDSGEHRGGSDASWGRLKPSSGEYGGLIMGWPAKCAALTIGNIGSFVTGARLGSLQTTTTGD